MAFASRLKNWFGNQLGRTIPAAKLPSEVQRFNPTCRDSTPHTLWFYLLLRTIQNHTTSRGQPNRKPAQIYDLPEMDSEMSGVDPFVGTNHLLFTLIYHSTTVPQYLTLLKPTTEPHRAPRFAAPGHGR